MPSQKAIKRRLESVKTTSKIMRALNMVAASRLQNCKNRLEYARSFFAESEKMIGAVKYNDELKDNQYMMLNETKSSAYFVVSSNRGMCGSYNSNILDFVQEHMSENGKNEVIVTMGSKGGDYFRRNGKDVYHSFDEMLETAFYESAVHVSHYLRNLYTAGMVDEVFVAYSTFDSAFAHNPTIKRILPISIDMSDNEEISSMGYDPDISVYLDHAVPAYLNTLIYLVMIESNACENAARMLNMDSAVNNATEIIDNLARANNRIRQAAITQEISEIISGWQ